MISPAEVASRKGVTERAVRDILANEERRSEIFPGATKIGSKYRGYWQIPETEAEQWQPRKYPRK